MSNYRFKGKGFMQLTGNNSNWVGVQAQTITSIGTQNAINGISVSNQKSPYSQIQSINPVTFTFSHLDQNIIRYEIIESKQDIIALSTCWSRLRKFNNSKSIDKLIISSLVDETLFAQVSQDDIDFANKIREYYVNKITVLTLKNIELSSFRKDLKDLVNSDGKKFKESIMPLAYRLPEFYEYDNEFEELIFNHNREVKNFNYAMDEELTMDLSLVKTFKVNNKRQRRKEYWFKDLHNNLITYYVDVSNPLIGLLDKLVENDIKITGKFNKQERDGFEFIKMHNLKFI